MTIHFVPYEDQKVPTITGWGKKNPFPTKYIKKQTNKFGKRFQLRFGFNVALMSSSFRDLSGRSS